MLWPTVEKPLEGLGFGRFRVGVVHLVWEVCK